MERNQAIEKLRQLIGRNLHDLAREYNITVQTASGTVNKGWIGHF